MNSSPELTTYDPEAAARNYEAARKNLTDLNEELNRVISTHAKVIGELRTKFKTVKEKMRPLNAEAMDLADKANLSRIEESGKKHPANLAKLDLSKFQPSQIEGAILRYGEDYLGLIDTLTNEMNLALKSAAETPDVVMASSLIQFSANIQKIEIFLSKIDPMDAKA
jgi:hypothetical protein